MGFDLTKNINYI